jgi:hypothetical protein
MFSPARIFSALRSTCSNYQLSTYLRHFAAVTAFRLIVPSDDSKSNDLEDMSAHLYLRISQTPWTQKLPTVALGEVLNLSALRVPPGHHWHTASHNFVWLLPRLSKWTKKENTLGGY